MESIRKAIERLEADEWDASHTLVQKGDTKLHFLVHALLHRIEGDQGNAGYWYRKADEPFPDNTISEELQRIKDMIDCES